MIGDIRKRGGVPINLLKLVQQTLLPAQWIMASPNRGRRGQPIPRRGSSKNRCSGGYIRQFGKYSSLNSSIPDRNGDWDVVA